MNIVITKKVIKVAQSLGVILNKDILEKLNIKEGDYIEINIKKVENGISK